MVTYRCDICHRKVKEEELETLILYKRSIDYCDKCATKANAIKNALKKSIRFYYNELDKQIQEAEKNILLRK